MCGIAGIIYKSAAAGVGHEVAERLLCSMAHRGPDGVGSFSQDGAFFAHARLAIVDIAGGAQPMFSADHRCGIVFNGEIYNYLDLRKTLERQEFSFSSNSDTEVILRAYERYGPDAFAMLNGMFAFCVWDQREKRVVLARDRFGIKPLYIYEDESCIVFASELKTILGLPGLDLSLDPAGIADYLVFRYIQAPFTAYRRIRRLDAGTWLEIREGKAVQRRFAALEYSDPYPARDAEELQQELSRKLSTAVSSQLMGEVPIGVLLSGGLDSSCIASYVRELGADLTTFNIGFAEVNEFEYSRAVAKALNLRHVEVIMTVDELAQRLPQVVWALDEPLADPACMPLYRLCEELKREVTVVFSGEGGDELFAGYPQYVQLCSEDSRGWEAYESFLDRSWYFRDGAELLRTPVPPHYLRLRKYMEDQPLLNGMLCCDMHSWMPENLMMKADKILMAHSLEGRFPFLDLELFQFAAAIPQRYKLANAKQTKWILKELMRKRLPPNIVDRPKMGFSVPIEHLLLRLKDDVYGTFQAAQGTDLAEILDLKRVRKQIDNFYAGRGVMALRIWTLFILLYWFTGAVPHYRSGSRQLVPTADPRVSVA